MVIQVPPRIIFGGRRATLIHSILKTVLEPSLKRLTYLPESRAMLWTEIVMWFGREETRLTDRELDERLIQ